MNRKLKTYLPFLLAIIPSGTFAAEPITVVGWPEPDTLIGEPPLYLGNDPVLGRLACPPLTRLNLEKKSSEGLVLRDIVTSNNGKTWLIKLRDGIYWWDETEVKAADVIDFFNQNLEKVIADLSIGLWKTPKFTITKLTEYQFKIQWQSKPSFGPFVFNGIPFYEKSKKNRLGYQCAGLYKIETTSNNGITLNSNDGYRFTKPSITFLNSETPAPPKAIKFKSSSGFYGSPWQRLSDTAIHCPTIDGANFSILKWNLNAKHINKAEVRKALTSLTPRGALLRSGSGDLGDLTSFPVPRSHPGYNRALKVRPFNSNAASSTLEKLGFHRKDPQANRKTPNGGDFNLKLSAVGQTSGLLEKVLIDAFAAVGITTTVESKTDELDGYIVGISSEWPHANFIKAWHSKSPSKNKYISFDHNDQRLNQLLESYSLELTTKQPNFSLLQKIHQKFYDLEPYSILVQHKNCIEIPKSVKEHMHSINYSNPDWFREIIF